MTSTMHMLASDAAHRCLHAVAVIATLVLLALAPRVYAATGAARATAADGATLYHNYCSVCHGDKGDGKSRASGSLSTVPRDFTSAASKQDLSRERIAAVIAHGKAGTAMVGWKTQLSSADIDVLAEHVYTRFVLGQGLPAAAAGATSISGTRAHGGREADASSSGSTPARVDMTVGLPNGLKGDSRRGGAFYLANCATCHGARGEGRAREFYPMVAAQHYRYLLREEQMIRDGDRRNANPDMIRVIKSYGTAELEAVADYMSRLPAPAP